jgi:type II secretory pathway pseudopilin PulG
MTEMTPVRPIPATHRPHNARGGFTLLEALVAIGLTTLIIAVIGSAIRLYFINLRQAQSNMELTELARNTLNLITSDIRSAIQYKPVDVSGLQELLDSQMAALSGPASAPASPDDGSSDETEGADSGNSQASENSAPNAAPSDATASTPTPPTDPPADRPKFIGDSESLVVDVSRLPRIDQYHPILHTNSVGQYTSLPTDIKTVAYFVDLSQTGEADSGGLYRREVDRVTSLIDATSDATQSDAAARPVAAEVVACSFRYFDGESWKSEWDSDDLGGFPSAVEVTLVIDPARTNPTQLGNYRLEKADGSALRTYRAVTKLPLAEILSEQEQQLIGNPTEFSSPTATGSSQEEK